METLGKRFLTEKSELEWSSMGWGWDQDRRQHVTGDQPAAQKGCEEVGKELGGR